MAYCNQQVQWLYKVAALFFWGPPDAHESPIQSCFQGVKQPNEKEEKKKLKIQLN